MLFPLNHGVRLVLLLPTVLTALVLVPVTVEGVFAQTNKQDPITIRSAVQEVDRNTGDVTARGDVVFLYPSQQIQGTAAEARYYIKERQIVFTGNAQVLQRGESLQGEKITCLIEKGLCTLTEN
jgi:lipopolysaccharide export system protein LptA